MGWRVRQHLGLETIVFQNCHREAYSKYHSFIFDVVHDKFFQTLRRIRCRLHTTSPSCRDNYDDAHSHHIFSDLIVMQRSLFLLVSVIHSGGEKLQFAGFPPCTFQGAFQLEYVANINKGRRRVWKGAVVLEKIWIVPRNGNYETQVCDLLQDTVYKLIYRLFIDKYR